MFDYKYHVEADHPTFRRIDCNVLNLQCLVKLLEEMVKYKYENVHVTTKGR